jgi:tetratricopeptide (TPR) repeat protein
MPESIEPDHPASIKPLGRKVASSEQQSWGVAAIFGLVLVCYWPALRGEFVWDDQLLVTRNPLVTGHFNLGSVWFRTDFPLTSVALWLQWLCWGAKPIGYHVVNVLLHAVNAILIWRVALRLKTPGAWLAGALFAVHPVCVGTAAWISEQKNTLSLVFYLGSFLLFLRSEQPSAAERHPRAAYGFSLLAFVLALLSKTTTVMLPVTLLISVWWRAGAISRRDLYRTSPFFALAFAFGLMTIWFQAHGAIKTAIVQTLNFWGRLAGAGAAVWFYLGKALCPVGLNLIYPLWKIDARAIQWYIPTALLAMVFGVCWRFRRSWGRHMIFALGSFVTNLFPALGFLNMFYLVISRVSDHFQYLPIVAIVIAVAAGLAAVCERTLPLREGSQAKRLLSIGAGARAIPFAFVAMGVFGALVALSRERASVFASEEGLWRATLAKNASAWPGHNNLGCVLAEKQDVGGAIEHFRDAIKLYPDNSQAEGNLGHALVLQGHFAEGESHFRTALSLNPGNDEAHGYYASVLAAQGRTAEAVNHFHEALNLRPKQTDTRMEYAHLLFSSGQVAESLGQYKTVLSQKPDSPEALNNAAWILATSGDDTLRDGRQAVEFAQHACRLTNFQEPRSLGTLAAAYAETGRFPEAISYAEMAVKQASALGDQRFAGLNQQLLKLYQAGRPYHERVAAPKKSQ